MKQLKFMIAAAAAIGLAGAAQADFPSATEKDALGNTGFEEFEVGDAGIDVTTGTAAADENSYFIYAGTVEADNESKIIKGSSGLTENEKSGRAKGDKFDDDQNVLQVNTGTEPLLRTINRAVVNEGQEPSSAAVSVPNDTGIYIDTLVQFTVTPAGDTVTPTADDKLMIYLQEVAPVMEGETVATPGATNLMVYCGRWTTTVDPEDLMAEPVTDYTGKGANVVTAGSISIKAGEWYRLVVKSQLLNGKSVFTATLNGTDLTSVNPLIDGKAETTYFPSLKPDDATLKAVGFAGEGLVDDIVFSTTLEAIETSVDFTFTWTDGISAVTYSIGGVTGQAVNKNEAVTGLAAGSVITLTITPADWYKLASAETITYTVPNATPAEFVSLDKYVTEAATVVGENITVSATTAPSDLGIAPGSSFYAPTASADAAANLSKAMTWAMKLGGATSAATAAGVVNTLNFEDANETEAEQAYLLDCSTEALDGEDGEIAKFKFVGFDLANGGFTVGKDKQVGDGNSYGNGYVEVRGSATIDGAYDEPADATQHNFFKAFLVPFAPVAE